MTDYKEMVRRITEIRAGGAVQRCHGIRHIGEYRNDSHQWGVAMLMAVLWPEDFPRLGLICLVHDVPERVVGDIPAPALRRIPGMKEGLAGIETLVASSLGLPSEHQLLPEDHAKMKACDHLELWLWAEEQHSLGNLYAAECQIALQELWETHPLPERAARFLHALGQNTTFPGRTGKIIDQLTAA